MSRPADEVVHPLKRPEFRNLMPISVTVALGFGMVIPVLPQLARSFGVSLAAVGLVQFVFGGTRFAFGLVAGLFVDRFGERASTIAGLLTVSLSSYAAGLAQTFPQLVLARGFGGAGSALFITGLTTRIIKIIEPQAMGRATGVFRSSFLVGIAAGPALGGLVANFYGTRAPLHFYATGLLFSAVITLAVMRGKERGAAQERKPPLEALREARPLFADLRYVVALLATFAGWWTASGPAQTVGVVFAREELAFSKLLVGVSLTMLALGEIIVLFVAGRAADRYGRRAVLVPSLAIAAAGTVLLGQVEPVPWFFLPAMLMIGSGIAASGAAAGGLLADAVTKAGSGAAVGVNQMAGDLGYLTAPTAVGAAAESQGYAFAYLLGALPAAAVAVVAARLPRGAPAGARRPHAEPAEPVG